MREQESSTHCETFLPSMSEDFNTCSWSAYRRGGDGANLHYHNGSIRDSYPAADSSYSGGYERDFMKQTMLEHEAVFKNQVHELHRLYRVQRKLVDEVKGKNSKEEFSFSDYTSETASKRQLPRYGEGSSSQACNGRLQNGFCSRDGNEVVPVKARRKMIDLQLPADEYLDTDETGDNEEITILPPFKRSKSGRGDASHQSNSSGSCLDVKNSNGLADLNEPLKCQDSEPVSLSRDMHAHYGRNNADVQGLCLEKNTSQNGWMVLEAGNSRSTHRDQLPSHSAQAFSNNGFQPQNYPTTDHNKVIFPGYRDLEVRSKNPQASYDSHVESSVASNTPRLHNDYRPDFVRPWSHWSSSWENPRSSSHQKSYPVQTNPYMNFVAHARTDSTFEMRSPASNGIYHGFSSGSKEAALNFPSAGFRPNGSVGEVVKNQSFESLQGPKKQERSAGLPWLKPKPLNRSEVSNGFLDLNASTNQSIDGTDTGDGLNSISPQKSLRSSTSCSYNANVGRVEMINPHSRKIIGCPIFEQPTIFKEEVNHLVKRDLDINLPCDASVCNDQHGTKAFRVGKEEGNKAGNFRHYIDLNSCASEDDEDSALHSSLRVKTKGIICIDLEAPPTLESEEEEDRESEKSNEETWGLMKGKDGNSLDELIKEAAQAIVAISLSDHQRLPGDAASSSTVAAGKSPLSWFADIITSQGDELERKADHEGDSSGEIDYFEAMTLNLHPTKEEDYMPEPLVPENLIFEVTGSNRPRRGQARRGRPKRDFQRDTLPGLPSLSRHEVNEDIQLFGGLMKSREHTWNSGVAARRNSKRKRIISQAPVCPSMAQPMNESVSVVELEDSKLTGWGKATRRPRRQRCPPAGNAATVILT